MSKCASLDVVCYLIRHLIGHTWKTIGLKLNIKLKYETRTSSKTCSPHDTSSEAMKRLVIEINLTTVSFIDVFFLESNAHRIPVVNHEHCSWIFSLGVSANQ